MTLSPWAFLELPISITPHPNMCTWHTTITWVLFCMTQLLYVTWCPNMQFFSWHTRDVQQPDDDHTPPAEILKCAALLSHNDWELKSHEKKKKKSLSTELKLVRWSVRNYSFSVRNNIYIFFNIIGLLHCNNRGLKTNFSNNLPSKGLSSLRLTYIFEIFCFLLHFNVTSVCICAN